MNTKMVSDTIRAALVAVTLAVAGMAQAGRPCEDTPLDAATVTRSMALAEKVAARLSQTSARVVVIARAGQDLDRWGVRWSHMGFAYRDESGAWRVVHELNHCATPNSALYRQGLGDFFLDRMYRYETAIVALRPDVQEKLLPILADDARIRQWHVDRYNMLAYPWALEYQQSNQWVLETLAGAMLDEGASRVEAQAWLKGNGYKPTVLRIDTLTRLGARLTRANIAFDDHPPEKRFAGRIETVTVDSALAWLKSSGLGSAAIHVR
jgi:hypothetical protein